MITRKFGVTHDERLDSDKREKVPNKCPVKRLEGQCLTRPLELYPRDRGWWRAQHIPSRIRVKTMLSMDHLAIVGVRFLRFQGKITQTISLALICLSWTESQHIAYQS